MLRLDASNLRDVAVPARRTLLWRWVAERWVAVAAAAIALPIAVVTVAGTLYWPGHPFPGFLVLGNTIVPTISVHDWTGAAVPFYARVVAVDGVPVTSNRDVYAHARAVPAGTQVRYALVKDGASFERSVPTMTFTGVHYWLTVGAFAAFGVFAIAASCAVFCLRPRTPAAWAFLSQGLFNGLFTLTGTALYHPDLWWLSRVHLFTNAMFSAAFIHLGLVFPETRRIVDRFPRIVAAPYAVAAALTAWMMRDFYTTPPGLDAFYATSRFTGAAIAALLAFVGYAAWEHRTPRQRTVLVAVLLGVPLGLYGFWNIAGPSGTFPINYVVFGGPFFYLFVAYAIVKHDLFDIDALVKQAAVYGTLTVGITGIYAAILAALGMFVPASVGAVPSTATVAVLVALAVAFQPLRAAVQRGIDRTFYRSRLDYRRTVGELSDALTSLLDLEEILTRVARSVAEGLQLRSLAIGLWIDPAATLWVFDATNGSVVAEPWPSAAALRAQLASRPGRAWYAARESPASESAGSATAAPAWLEVERLGAALLVPLAVRGQTIGAFVLGPRRSGRRFTREDVELLGTLAAQSAVAIQNAQSYRALQALNDDLEVKVRSRTAALEASTEELAASNRELADAYESLKAAQAQLLTTEKMASLGLVVAGVAHEINNPLSFIVGNVQPLHDTLARVRAVAAAHRDADLAGEVDRLAKILDLMALGAERTATIVQDLRTFSRLGEEAPRPTDLNEAIEVNLRLLRPRWADRITIHREYAPLEPVEVIPGQINQVFMNLLANGCDAIRGRGNLWIRTSRTNDRVVVTLRDDGTGIAPEHVGRIFDPFFTTKPVGQGTGLGLAITHGIISQHGGTITVTTESGRGTEFRIELPAARTLPRAGGDHHDLGRDVGARRA